MPGADDEPEFGQCLSESPPAPYRQVLIPRARAAEHQDWLFERQTVRPPKLGALAGGRPWRSPIEFHAPRDLNERRIDAQSRKTLAIFLVLRTDGGQFAKGGPHYPSPTPIPRVVLVAKPSIHNDNGNAIAPRLAEHVWPHLRLNQDEEARPHKPEESPNAREHVERTPCDVELFAGALAKGAPRKGGRRQQDRQRRPSLAHRRDERPGRAQLADTANMHPDRRVGKLGNTGRKPLEQGLVAGPESKPYGAQGRAGEGSEVV